MSPPLPPWSSDHRGEARLRVPTPCGQITKKQCCWSGALRLGFTSKDPSYIHPDSLPKYACPDLVSQSGFWAKALPEEFANEGNIIAFWVDKKGRVFYRINDSAVMLFFNGVRTADPLWALVDVYGLTRGVQLLGEYRPSALLVSGQTLQSSGAGTDLRSHESRGAVQSPSGSEQLQGFLWTVVSPSWPQLWQVKLSEIMTHEPFLSYTQLSPPEMAALGPALVRLMLLSVTIVSEGVRTKHSHPGTFFEETHIQGC